MRRATRRVNNACPVGKPDCGRYTRHLHHNEPRDEEQESEPAPHGRNVHSQDLQGDTACKHWLVTLSYWQYVATVL